MWSRRGFMAGVLGSLAYPALAGDSSKGRLIVVVASGGWDPSFVLDPKPGIDSVDGPEPDLDPTNPDDIESVVSLGGLTYGENRLKRPSVSAFIENWGSQMAVVRGVSTGSLSHGRSLARMLNGVGEDQAPDLCARVGAEDAYRSLGYVDLSGLGRFGPYGASSARWGPRGQGKALVNPAVHFKAPAHTALDYPLLRPDPNRRALTESWLARRIDRYGDKHPQASVAAAVQIEALDRAAALREQGAALTASIPWGDRFSVTSDMDLAVALMREDACRAVLLHTRQAWDTHTHHERQHNSWNTTFRALGGLMTGLSEAGQLGNTTVLVLSEMGRTPRRNIHGGTDHWPFTSAMVLGAGVRGGHIGGGTDDLLQSLPTDPSTGQTGGIGDPLTPDQLVAGVLELVGVDGAAALPGVSPYRGWMA